MVVWAIHPVPGHNDRNHQGVGDWQVGSKLLSRVVSLLRVKGSNLGTPIATVRVEPG